MRNGIVPKEVFDGPSWGSQAGEEAFKGGSFFVVSWAFLKDVVAAVEPLSCGGINARGAGGAVGFDEVFVILTCVSVAICELGEVAHLWVSVRTMIFMPDFSFLFCLTHFSFVNFSYP